MVFHKLSVLGAIKSNDHLKKSSVYIGYVEDSNNTGYSNLAEMMSFRSKASEPPIDELKGQLLNALSLFHYETNDISSAESLIFSIYNDYGLATLARILHDIISTNLKNEDILVGICVSLERFDYSETSPWGYSFIATMLVNRSERVQEAVISLIENWLGDDLIELLKGIEFPKEWMKNYVSKMILRRETVKI